MYIFAPWRGWLPAGLAEFFADSISMTRELEGKAEAGGSRGNLRIGLTPLTTLPRMLYQ